MHAGCAWFGSGFRVAGDKQKATIRVVLIDALNGDVFAQVTAVFDASIALLLAFGGGGVVGIVVSVLVFKVLVAEIPGFFDGGDVNVRVRLQQCAKGGGSTLAESGYYKIDFYLSSHCAFGQQ